MPRCLEHRWPIVDSDPMEEKRDVPYDALDKTATWNPENAMIQTGLSELRFKTKE